jgi:hypothetical protein
MPNSDIDKNEKFEVPALPIEQRNKGKSAQKSDSAPELHRRFSFFKNLSARDKRSNSQAQITSPTTTANQLSNHLTLEPLILPYKNSESPKYKKLYRNTYGLKYPDTDLSSRAIIPALNKAKLAGLLMIANSANSKQMILSAFLILENALDKVFAAINITVDELSDPQKTEILNYVFDCMLQDYANFNSDKLLFDNLPNFLKKRIDKKNKNAITTNYNQHMEIITSQMKILAKTLDENTKILQHFITTPNLSMLKCDIFINSKTIISYYLHKQTNILLYSPSKKGAGKFDDC